MFAFHLGAQISYCISTFGVFALMIMIMVMCREKSGFLREMIFFICGPLAGIFTPAVLGSIHFIILPFKSESPSSLNSEICLGITNVCTFLFTLLLLSLLSNNFSQIATIAILGLTMKGLFRLIYRKIKLKGMLFILALLGFAACIYFEINPDCPPPEKIVPLSDEIQKPDHFLLHIFDYKESPQHIRKYR